MRAERKISILLSCNKSMLWLGEQLIQTLLLYVLLEFCRQKDNIVNGLCSMWPEY